LPSTVLVVDDGSILRQGSKMLTPMGFVNSREAELKIQHVKDAWDSRRIPSRKLTYPNDKAYLKMIFFSPGGIC